MPASTGSITKPAPACTKPPYTPTSHKPMRDFGFSATVIGKVPLGCTSAERLKKANAATDNMVISSMGFNTATGANEATSAPNRPPIKVGHKIAGKSCVGNLPAWRKPCKPDTDCSNTPTRLLPLAISAGTPNIINTGKIRLEPPPAIILITPAATPSAANKRYW